MKILPKSEIKNQKFENGTFFLRVSVVAAQRRK
jgi:hypothetical protein